jgi:hypothetical protein
LSGRSIRSITVDGKSSTVDQEIGVFQGDCLSPILFNITINLLLEGLSDEKFVRENGVTVHEKKRMTNESFADDITLLLRSLAAARKGLDLFRDMLRWTRCLKAAPHKFMCAAYGFKDVGGRESLRLGIPNSATMEYPCHMLERNLKYIAFWANKLVARISLKDSK